MYKSISTNVGSVALAVLAAVLAASAGARDKYRSKIVEPPLKDCTRINGRWGFDSWENATGHYSPQITACLQLAHR